MASEYAHHVPLPLIPPPYPLVHGVLADAAFATLLRPLQHATLCDFHYHEASAAGPIQSWEGPRHVKHVV